MDKSAIKNFSIEARKVLMRSAETEAGFYGVTRNACKNPIQKGNDFEVYETLAGTENRIYGADIKKRANLVEAVETLGFDQVIEETAYTWFNRIIAIRFMEVNGYLPTRVRVLSSETGSNTPDIVTQSLDVDLNMTPEELEKVQKAKDENRYDEAFRMLFVKQCNELNAILPGLFEKTDDYMELLLKLSYTSDGVVRMLIDTVAEDNFNIETEGQVEIIGWMYQYYITEKHEEVVDPLRGKVVEKNDIPAATQLFTTDWVVKYLVDNSLGRYWIERNPNSLLKSNLSYYINIHENKIYKEEKIEPNTIKVFDPCMGSAHFLVYAFDVLMKIYKECGYSERDAARSIVEDNLYGLDIDDRAFQMSYFAVLMKARQYDRRLLSNHIKCNIYSIKESNNINKNHLNYFGSKMSNIEKQRATEQMNKLINQFVDAKEYGSLLTICDYDWNMMEEYLELSDDSGQLSFDSIGIEKTQAEIKNLIEVGKIMSDKYNIVMTNPPYLNKYDMKLKEYVTDYYKDYSGDLFSVFIVKNLEYCIDGGYSSYMTPNVWMFIVSYEKLRKYLIDSKSISSLIQMAKGAFFKEATVDICAFILQNSRSIGNGTYFRLENFKGDMEVQRQAVEEALKDKNCGYFFETNQKDFKMIDGYPIAYWINENVFSCFKNKLNSVSSFAQSEGKNVTTKNAKYILYYWEVCGYDIGAFDKKWLPCATGGDYRKWFGNIINVIDWSPETRAFYKKAQAGRIIREEYWNMPGVTWGKISSAASSFRILDRKEMYQETAILQNKEEDTLFVLALLNTKVISFFLEFLSPTLNYQLQDICSIPVPKMSSEQADLVRKLCCKCIEVCKEDWDSFEVSMNFKRNPLTVNGNTIEDSYHLWSISCINRFDTLKQSEEELNKLFIELYGLENEVSFIVPDKEISVRKANLQREIKGLISYAVGCIFGRYSLDNEGVICSGGNLNNEYYVTFLPDKDGIIPITDEEYFSDDIVSRFCEWIKIVYGEKNLDKNLDFIAKALGGKGDSSRSIIRNYFIRDFYSDHCKVYQKRPIYWLFDSGKENGFKCLFYIHRYSKDTLNLVRSEYLHKTENSVENALKNVEYIIQTTTSAVEKAKATKDRDKYVKQLNEMRIYFQALSHLAIQKIEIDLDNGVKNNYQLFQGIELIVDGGKKQIVDLLTKI